jgi:hypothetical protein
MQPFGSGRNHPCYEHPIWFTVPASGRRRLGNVRISTSVRTVLGRIGRSSWETRVAVAIPLLLALLALPVMFGVFASGAAPGGVKGGYGPPPKPTFTLPVTTHPHPHPKPCNPHSPHCP